MSPLADSTRLFPIQVKNPNALAETGGCSADTKNDVPAVRRDSGLARAIPIRHKGELPERQFGGRSRGPKPQDRDGDEQRERDSEPRPLLNPMLSCQFLGSRLRQYTDSHGPMEFRVFISAVNGAAAKK